MKLINYLIEEFLRIETKEGKRERKKLSDSSEGLVCGEGYDNMLAKLDRQIAFKKKRKKKICT